MKTTPIPRLGRWILLKILPDRVRKEVVDVLTEEFQSRHKQSRAMAHRWFWRQVARSIAPAMRLLREGRARVHGPGIANHPIDVYGLQRDLRHACRLLVRRPGFSILAVGMIGLSIGLNTAMLSVVRGTLFHQFPYADSDQLRVLLGSRSDGSLRDALGIPELWDIAERTNGIGPVGIYSRTVRMGLATDGGTDPIKAMFINEPYLDVLQAQPFFGRGFGPNANRPPDSPAEVILMHDSWVRRFGSDPAVIGRSIVLSSRPYQIVGVMKPGFRTVSNQSDPVEALLPLTTGQSFLGANMFDRRPARQYGGVIRLQEGITDHHVAQQLDQLAIVLERVHPESNEGWRYGSHTLSRFHFGTNASTIWALLAGALFVLLLCGVNVAALLYEHGNGRQREIALRMSIGAGRIEITRQLLTEAVVIAALGGTLGVVVGTLGVHFVTASVDLGLPRFVKVTVDPVVLFLTLAGVLSIGVTFGFFPAWRASRIPHRVCLTKQRLGRYGGSRVVMVEVAITTVLVIAAGLAGKNVWRLALIPLGYDIEHALTFSIDLTGATSETDSTAQDGHLTVQQARQITFAEQFLDRIETLPGISAGTLAGPDPLGTAWWGVAITPAHLDPNVAGQWWAHTRILMTANSFEVLGIPLVEGRPFTRNDRMGAPKVVIVDEDFARVHWPDESPIGQQLYQHPAKDVWTVVGLVEPAMHNGRLAPDKRGYIYFPYTQRPRSFVSALVRTKQPQVISMVTKMIHSIDQGAVVYDVASADERIRQQESMPRLTSAITASYGGATVVMAMIGIYGVIGYRVSRRAHDLAVRSAVGATRRQVVNLVLAGGAKEAAIGVVVGLITALLLRRSFSSVVTHVSTFDHWVYGSAAGLLLVSACGACLLPALRASRISPIVLLREE